MTEQVRYLMKNKNKIRRLFKAAADHLLRLDARKEAALHHIDLVLMTSLNKPQTENLKKARKFIEGM